jgi:hypothetical protein
VCLVFCYTCTSITFALAVLPLYGIVIVRPEANVHLVLVNRHVVPRCESEVLRFHSTRMSPSLSHSLTLVTCLNYFVK